MKPAQLPDWQQEYLNVVEAYPQVQQDPELPPSQQDKTALWSTVLENRGVLFEEYGVLSSADSLPADQKRAAQGFVMALCETWDDVFMRGGGSWKNKVVDQITEAVKAGVQVVGTSEWDPELNAMVKAQGLAISSSHRDCKGKEGDGNAVIYDPNAYRLVEEKRHVFENTKSSTGKIAHQALLEHKHTGDLLLVQSAHLEKEPDDSGRNEFRRLQVIELEQLAHKAYQQGATVLLLSDTNSEATFPGPGGTPVENPVETALKEAFPHLHRPEHPTAVTVQRSMSIDVVAGKCPPGSFLGTEQQGRLSEVQASMASVLPGEHAEVLPNSHNPSDHTWAVDLVPTPSGGVVAGTWNVLSGRYRNPLKGNLFYPLAFLFDSKKPEDSETLGLVNKMWGQCYTTSKKIPGWQKGGVPHEQAFASEYLVGPVLERLNEMRLTIDKIVEAWTPSERANFEKAKSARPDVLKAHSDYPNNAEVIYLITERREQLLEKLVLSRSPS